MLKSKLKLIILLFIFIASCVTTQFILKSPINHKKLFSPPYKTNYSFLCGGHLYGSPQKFLAGSTQSVSGTLLNNISKINSSNALFFVSLGDSYWCSAEPYLSNFKKGFIKNLKMPVFISPGNHEMTDRKLYTKNFGNQTYYSYSIASEIYIILDTEIDTGVISGKQLKFLKKTLTKTIGNSDIKNIFIFSHKLIWSVNNPTLKIVYDHLNARKGYTTTDNFKKDIEPIIITISKEKSVYWISGDIGVGWSFPLFYWKDPNNNITYIATGIGDTNRDVILQVNIKKDGNEITFKPISLTGEKSKKIEYYNLNFLKKCFPEKNK